MIDFIKRLIIFALGVGVVLFIFNTVLGGFSLSGTIKEISGSFQAIRELGQPRGTSTRSLSQGNTDTTSKLSKYTSTSKGAGSAVTFLNITRGEMVNTQNTIVGNIKASWLVDGVGTARFLDEVGDPIGSAQVTTNGVPDSAGMIPFSIVPQLSQSSAKTGYIVIEKVNNTGQSKNDEWVSLPVAYPVRGGEAIPVMQSATSSVMVR